MKAGPFTPWHVEHKGDVIAEMTPLDADETGEKTCLFGADIWQPTHGPWVLPAPISAWLVVVEEPGLNS